MPGSIGSLSMNKLTLIRLLVLGLGLRTVLFHLAAKTVVDT